MITNNLGQPTFHGILELLCSTCDAVICAGCPVNEGINRQRLGQIEYFGDEELKTETIRYCSGHAAPVVNGYCFDCGLPRVSNSNLEKS